MKEEISLVTEDRWMKESGQLDAADREMLKEASQNGRARVRVINMREMLEIMKTTAPEKFEKFKETMEGQASRRLTFDDLVELGWKADEKMQEFDDLVKSLTLGQAEKIRRWRIKKRMTWRRVAREAFMEGWFHRGWGPPSNQIMGMALCKKAALFFEEKFREPPWN